MNWYNRGKTNPIDLYNFYHKQEFIGNTELKELKNKFVK